MREVLQTRNRAFGPNGVPTTSRQTSATRTDTTSRSPISLGSTNKTCESSTPTGTEKSPYCTLWPIFSLARKPNLLILGSIPVDAFAYLVATVFTGYFLNYAQTD